MVLFTYANEIKQNALTIFDKFHALVLEIYININKIKISRGNSRDPGK